MLFMKLPAEILKNFQIGFYDLLVQQRLCKNAQTIAASPSRHMYWTPSLTLRFTSHVNLLNIMLQKRNDNIVVISSKLFQKLPAYSSGYLRWFPTNTGLTNSLQQDRVAVSPMQTHVLDANLDVTALPNNALIEYPIQRCETSSMAVLSNCL